MPDVKPLILDFEEKVEVVYDGETGGQICGITSTGTYSEPDSDGADAC